MKRILLGLLLLISCGVFGFGVWMFVAREQTESPEPVVVTVDSTVADGRYVQYDPVLAADTKYQRTILFFYDADDSESKAFDGALSADTIPEKTQILRVTMGSHVALVKKYDVATPATFVQVMSDGDVLSWQGYGKTKSAAAVLDNLQ